MKAKLALVKPVPGPHHCAAAGKRARNWVFDAILREADRHGGSISRKQIEAIELAFANSESSLFDASTSTYDFCMSAFDRPHIKKFDKAAIFRFLIGAYISDLLPTIFAEQQAHSHGKWKMMCSTILVNAVREHMRIEVDEKYYDLYKSITLEKGRNFSLHDLLNDPGVIDLTSAIVEQARRMFEHRKRISTDLCAEFNEYLRKKIDPNDKRILFVKVRQISALLNAIVSEKTGNDFRASVLAVKVPARESHDARG